MKRPALALAFSALLSAHCMPPIRQSTAFSSRYQDNSAGAVRDVYGRLPSVPAGAPAPTTQGGTLLAGVRQGNNRAVVLWDTASGRALWTSPLNAASVPEVLGDVVVVADGPRIAGLDAGSGRPRWTADPGGMTFIGAARGGDTVVLVSSLGANGSSTRVGRVIAVDATSGAVRWSHQVLGILGHPAVSGGYAFVPWDRQSLAVIDLATGVERARLRTTDDVLAWVFSGPEGVYYGSRGAYRWTPRSASGTRSGSAYLANPLENVPGDPALFRDAFNPTSGARSARDKIRFAFLPRSAEGDSMAVANDTLYLSYYRFLLAVDVRNGEVRWARSFSPDDTRSAQGPTALDPYDVTYLAVTPRSLVAVTDDGTLHAIDPTTGAVQGTQSLGMSLAAMSGELRGFNPPTAGASPAPSGSVREQLVALIRDPDNRLVPMRAFLIRLLARREEQEVTRDLLELYRQRSMPNVLRQEIATALRTRRNGAQYLVAALTGDASHYNYLENRQAPPLDVIAPTLAAMGAREAVPVLMQHLLDHETPLAQLAAVIGAVAELGDASVIPQLQAFVQRYHSDSAFAGDNSTPLQTACHAIFRLGDVQARAWLTELRNNTSAHAPVREAIARFFTEETQANQNQSRDQQLTAARQELQGAVNSLRATIRGVPANLTQDAFDQEWTAHLDDLRACASSVLTRRPDLNEIRITVTVRSEPANGLFTDAPPQARLPQNATFEQQLEAVATQRAWVDQQVERIENYRSSVRTIAYSPQDPTMAQCMNGVLQPLRFPGFGREVGSRTFQQRISTARQVARSNYNPGYGTAAGSTMLVPWFLVSSPSFNAAAGELVPLTPEQRGGRPGGGARPAGGNPSGNAGTQGSGGPPNLGGPPNNGSSGGGGGGDRPWWDDGSGDGSQSNGPPQPPGAPPPPSPNAPPPQNPAPAGANPPAANNPPAAPAGNRRGAPAQPPPAAPAAPPAAPAAPARPPQPAGPPQLPGQPAQQPDAGGGGRQWWQDQ